MPTITPTDAPSGLGAGLGYGLSAFAGRGLFTPYSGIAFTEVGTRTAGRAGNT